MRRCLVNTSVAIGSYEYYLGFLKAAFVMVSLSNRCISLICLQCSKLTWRPNVPNASGVGLFWDKKYPLELPYSILIKNNNSGKIQRKCWKTIKFLIFSSNFFFKNNLSVIFTNFLSSVFLQKCFVNFWNHLYIWHGKGCIPPWNLCS